MIEQIVSAKHKLDCMLATNPVLDKSLARKYIEDYFVYYAEKQLIIKLADLPSNAQCLDISTGAGMLPWMLCMAGHYCDATDIEDYSVDVDPDKGNQDGFRVMRDFFGVTIKDLRIEKNTPTVLDRHYDCIFSTRIVFNNDWAPEHHVEFINDVLKYTNKLVLKWNFETHECPEELQPFMADTQFENGTITIHS